MTNAITQQPAMDASVKVTYHSLRKEQFWRKATAIRDSLSSRAKRFIVKERIYKVYTTREHKATCKRINTYKNEERTKITSKWYVTFLFSMASNGNCHIHVVLKRLAQSPRNNFRPTWPKFKKKIARINEGATTKLFTTNVTVLWLFKKFLGVDFR